MAKQSDALTIAVLGLLNESPLHGYELRKRLDVLMGPLRRRISFGSLYPALRALEASGWISQSDPAVAPPLAGRRARVVYQLTGAGEDHLQALLASSGPSAWEDEQFDVHFTFFGRTDTETRIRILQGRRTRVLERAERARAALTLRQARESSREVVRPDSWGVELARHTLESLERELRWLDALIDRERGVVAAPAPPSLPTASRPSVSLPSTSSTSLPSVSGVPSTTATSGTNSEPTGQLSTNQ